MKKSCASTLLAMSMAAALLPEYARSVAAENVDYNSKGWDAIMADAEKESKVNFMGIPGTWVSWIGTWQGINDEYDITHKDLGINSSEEIALFKEEGKDGAKDIDDMKQQWGPVAESEGMTLKYKISYWDDIPSRAKSDDGDWTVCYVGTISIITNNALVDKVPQGFQDILEGDYKVTIGDVSATSQIQRATLTTAYAMGNDMDNLQSAYDFWSTLAKEGRIDTGDTGTARIEPGGIAVGLFQDYNALNCRDNAVSNSPDISLTVCMPSGGGVQNGYASIINANASNPSTACLAREYILSDQKQISLVVGYTTSIHSNVVIPAEVQARRINQGQYASAHTIEDFDKWTNVHQDITTYQGENIVPTAKQTSGEWGRACK